MRFIFIALVLIGLGGCGANFKDLDREPEMSPVGSGLKTAPEASAAAFFPPPRRQGEQSLWDGSRSDLFSDQRAAKVGDVVTVNIAINDKATFGNTSGRSTDNTVNLGLDYNLGTNTPTTYSTDLTSKSGSQGQGTIDRSEKIQLSIAAVVSQVLPNGNLVVSGSQEVRVNYELRLLKIAGIIRPSDISKDNSISYDKIAEARISYGGRGRISEVQQPSWGQQIYDAVKPF
jgi:flagellar L-ring protein precursor FlgH